MFGQKHPPPRLDLLHDGAAGAPAAGAPWAHDSTAGDAAAGGPAATRLTGEGLLADADFTAAERNMLDGRREPDAVHAAKQAPEPAASTGAGHSDNTRDNAARSATTSSAGMAGNAGMARNAAHAAGTAQAAQPESLVRSDSFRIIRSLVLASMNVSAAVLQTRDQVQLEIARLASEIVERERLKMTLTEQSQVIDEILNDMFGVGPIEPLLTDETVTDILVNGADQVYVERHGKLELTRLKFRDNAHVVNVAQRIAAAVGRRVDESSPMVDARLADGSRVNVVLPPLAIRGACIAIRKFAKRDITLERMATHGSLSAAMARTLEIGSACRLNIIVSGGTGSGKTTLLNAMSRYIDARERIVTIEDAAELQLQQPHVVSLETRPENAEGLGAVSQRDLVRNALRMRPDRIILGETRGPEAFDVLQAMNTGHDGSMTTIHANTPRDAITRLESMVMMANGNLPLLSIRRQVASAVHLIVQTERMRDGVRRVTHITEVVGLEGDVILTQDLFLFRYDDGVAGDEVGGRFECSALRPAFVPRAARYGLEENLMNVIHS